MVYDMARAINPPVNALGAYTQGMQLGQQANAAKEANLLAKARKGYGRNAFMAAQGEGGQFDADAYAKAVAQDAAAAGDFDYFSNAQDVVGKSQKNRIDANKDGREGEKHQFEQLGSQLKLQGQLLGGVRDQATWEQALRTAQANGIDVSNIPTQYSPKVVQDITQMTLTAQERLEQEWKRKGFDLDVAKFGYQQSNDAMNRSVTIRGQNMADARSRQSNEQAPAGYRWAPDGSLAPIPGGPKDSTTKSQSALDIISMADDILAGKGVDANGKPIKAELPTSSPLAAAGDYALRTIGKSRPSADAAAQLRALQGALMLNQPRMEGPQSDKDVALYERMAGQIGDPTVPISQKQAALKIIRQFHEKATNSGANQPQPPRPGTVQEGYLFRGGSPADPASWSKVR